MSYHGDATRPDVHIMSQADVIRRAGQTVCVSCCDYPATTRNSDGDDVCSRCVD